MSVIPDDDLSRDMTVSDVDSPALSHIGLAGDSYTILLSGKDTAGKYCLIDMYIPPGGGPPPHRHDFEESFTVLEGSIEGGFRGEKIMLFAGSTFHIPANAPHQFQNKSNEIARLLCICSPAGQEEYFAQVGVPVASRTSPPPPADPATQATMQAKAESLAAEYKTEFLK